MSTIAHNVLKHLL